MKLKKEKKKKRRHRCWDCIYFKDVRQKKIFSHRRKALRYTCKSIGLNPKGKACRKFEARTICATCALYPCKKKVKATDVACKKYIQIYDLSNPQHQLIFTNILVDAFHLEQDAEIAMELIVKKMREKGFSVPLSKSKFRSYVERCNTLWVLNRIIDSMGLSLHKDEILKHEIARLFTPRIVKAELPIK